MLQVSVFLDQNLFQSEQNEPRSLRYQGATGAIAAVESGQKVCEQKHKEEPL